MQNLGIRILFEGNNFLRLLGGLLVSLKIAVLSMALSVGLGILLGMVMTSKKKAGPNFYKALSGDSPDHASAGSFVSCLLWSCKAFECEFFRSNGRGHCIHLLGDG